MGTIVAEKISNGIIRMKPIKVNGEVDNLGPTCQADCRVFCGLVNGLACTNFIVGQVTADLTYEISQYTAEQAVSHAGCSPTYFG